MDFPSFTFQAPKAAQLMKKKSTILYTIDKSTKRLPYKLKYDLFCAQPLGKPNLSKAAIRKRYYQFKLSFAKYIPQEFVPLQDIEPLNVVIPQVKITNPELHFLRENALTNPEWYKYYAFHPKNRENTVIVMEKAIEVAPNEENWKFYLFALQYFQEDAEIVQMRYTTAFILFDSIVLKRQYLFFLSTNFNLFSLDALTDAFKLANDVVITCNFISFLQLMDYKERALVLVLSFYISSQHSLEQVYTMLEQDNLVWDNLRNYANVPASINDFDGDDPEEIVLLTDIQDLLFSCNSRDATDILMTYLCGYGLDLFYLKSHSLDICGIPSDFISFQFNKSIFNSHCAFSQPSQCPNFLGSVSSFMSNFLIRITNGLPFIPFLHFSPPSEICNFRLEILNHFQIEHELRIHDLVHIDDNKVKMMLTRNMDPTIWFYYIWHLLKLGKFNQCRKLYSAYLQQITNPTILIMSVGIELYVFKNSELYENHKNTVDSLINSIIKYKHHYWVGLVLYGMTRLQLIQPEECLRRFYKIVEMFPISDVWLLIHTLQKEYALDDLHATNLDDFWVVELIKSWITDKCPRYFKNSFILHLRAYYGKADCTYKIMNDVVYDAALQTDEIKEKRGFRIRNIK